MDLTDLVPCQARVEAVGSEAVGGMDTNEREDIL